MKRFEVHALDGPDGLRLSDAEEPGRAPGRALVDVHVVHPAFPDLLMARGRYQVQPEPPYVPASDFSGVVREDCDDGSFIAGQRVAGFLDHGAASQVVSVPFDRLYPLPDDLSFDLAAAMPLNYLTSLFALLERGALNAGEWLLVRGAAGSVGLASIQIANALGARTIGLVSTEAKAAVVERFGAVAIVGNEALPERVRNISGGGVDMVLDVVGGDLSDSLRTLRPTGRLMSVGFASGTIPTVKVNRLLLSNLDLRGVEWGLALERGDTRKHWANLMGMRREHQIAPLVTKVRPLEEFAATLAGLGLRSSLGCTVVRMR